MLLDATFRTTQRNFSTFALIVALVTVPLNLVYALVYRDILALTELHDAIEALPPAESIGGITAPALRNARIIYIVVVALEIVALPFISRAFARALDIDEAGHVPGALASWRSVLNRRPPTAAKERFPIAVIAMAGLVAALVFALSYWIGLLLTEPLPDSLAWLGVGLTRSLAPALALPWVLVPLVQVRREAAQPRGDESKSSR